MIIRSGRGIDRLGQNALRIAVSAVMVPSSSMPVKEKIAIWKPAKKPVMPWGIKAVGR